jgi:KaiC/GvpD/RAD55 family RecA-like ATPase
LAKKQKIDNYITPYSDVFIDIVKSVMLAQADVAIFLKENALDDVPDSLINRHFCWLATVWREGINRHLFDGGIGLHPLRRISLRHHHKLPSELKKLLKERQSVPWETAYIETIIQPLPTRISRLIKSSFFSADEADQESSGEALGSKQHMDQAVQIKSPLSVVYDFLTIPTLPASRAYALLTTRNFIFETFDIFPADVGIVQPSRTFSKSDLEDALSHIWTSLRPRYNAKGQDTLTAEARLPAGSMVRHFLAARGVLLLRFLSLNAAHAFFSSAQLRAEGNSFTFSRSPHLERLPESGELANELWGLPVPVRGGDTIFRGGLRFSSRRGLVMGLHGGPGAGKTSLALALGAVLAPFGIKTLFISAEEAPADLEHKLEGLVPDEMRRLSFFPKKTSDWLEISHIAIDEFINSKEDQFEELEKSILELKDYLNVVQGNIDPHAAPKPCRAIIVLDGIHDLIMAASDYMSTAPLVQRLRHFIGICRNLHALVILTAGQDWEGETALDYLVDVAVKLGHDAVEDYGRKPTRQITVSKARHQLCSVGTHGILISGAKGVRFSPQINYQLDRKALWRTRLPEMNASKKVLGLLLPQDVFAVYAKHNGNYRPRGGWGFQEIPTGLKLYRGSNVFLNGEGSGGKAALALKMAISPTYENSQRIDRAEKVLIVSFLYPRQYYENILNALLKVRQIEYGILSTDQRPTIEVIHLYPGNYRADQLFNRVDWEFESADLQGDPYSAIIIDGLHNVFLQFPEIEAYTLFWPQFYAALRSRPITIISTHTTFVLQGAAEGGNYRLDDERSEPLRHALVQKTDFRFEVDPYILKDGYYEKAPGTSISNVFGLRTISAINQPIPDFELMWSREHLLLFDAKTKFGKPVQSELKF